METPTSILNHLKEIKEKESKAEVKLEKISPDEEAEEIKKELDEKVSDERTLKKPEPLIKVRKPEIPKIKGFFDDKFWLYATGGIVFAVLAVLAALVLVFLNRKSSSQPLIVEQPNRSKVRNFDIGGGKIIQIPV